MQTVLIFILAAVSAYLAGSWNPAITFSRAVYKKDIRECGSGNAGFTNFKRSFGGALSWVVLTLDLLKAAAVCIVFALAFKIHMGQYMLGAFYTGAFALLGHALPVWYGFKGGKGFLVCLSVIFVADWRVGLIATGIMIVLLLTTHYMSLSTVSALLVSPVFLALLGASPWETLACLALTLFVALRHHENFGRLIKGTERKFYLTKKADSK